MIADRYTLDREIGRGGMGTVWLGRDEVLGREVALKRIGMVPGAGRTDLARAEREARLAARLDHPHVVAVLNLVVEADEQWLVMEYVDGTTLGELVQRQGALSPDAAAPLLWQVADALAAAHAAGIVHRDVKPSNILVARDGKVKLTDFGIARVAADPALTQTGFVTGSPAYLAPEVAAGARADEAADVWSLGATVYHVLSGRPPYDIGEHVLGALYRIVNEDPPELTDAGWMAPLLAATMSKDPARRWSMGQVRDFLAAPGSRHAPAGASAESPTRTLKTVLGRPAILSGRTWLAGALGLAVAIVLGLSLATVLPGDEPAADRADGSPSPRGSTPSPSGPATAPDEAAEPSAAGMEQFVRDYVAALSAGPDAAWPMLTPKFQRESGGLDAYREFWAGVGPGRLLEVSADPATLVVRYRVRFEDFGTGRRPTVLQLVFDGSRYLIDGELTEGFVPVT